MRTVILVYIFLSSLAQAAIQTKPVGEKEFLDKFKQYATFKELKVDFTQMKHIEDLSFPLKATGRLEVRRPGIVRWEIITPSRLVVDLTPTEVRIESGEGEAVQKQVFPMSKAATESKTWNALSPWMDLNPKEIYSRYEVTSEKKGVYRMIPREIKSSPFKSLQITLSDRGHIKSLDFEEASSDRMVFDFGTPKIK